MTLILQLIFVIYVVPVIFQLFIFALFMVIKNWEYILGCAFVAGLVAFIGWLL